jgi:integrase
MTRDQRGRLVERPRVKLVRDEQDRLVEKQLGPFAGWKTRGAVMVLSLVLDFAVRRGFAVANAVARLERKERPRVERREMRVLERDEIQKLLAAAPDRYRPLLATAVFTGLRVGELLGLTWADVDFDAGFVRVRKRPPATSRHQAA